MEINKDKSCSHLNDNMKYEFYKPVENGYTIKINSVCNESETEGGNVKSSVQSNVRLHRRPLYLPADKTMIWNDDELKKLERLSFRPLIIAYNEPRFVFDFHTAGGLLGNLFIGINIADKKSKWLHQWSQIQITYSEGIMKYIISDAEFPEIIISLEATAMASSAGMMVRIKVCGDCEGLSIIWCYGGASAFYTCYDFENPEFIYHPLQCKKDLIKIDKFSFSLIRAFDDTDTCMNTKKMATLIAPNHLLGWKAHIQGGATGKSRIGFGDPYKVKNSPYQFISSVEWSDNHNGNEKVNCVAAGECKDLEENECILIFGMGGDINNNLSNQSKAWNEALKRNKEITEKVQIFTPDTTLNAATSLIAFGLEGIWGDEAILHGAWSWRSAYLGWRGWYGVACYGWLDRIKKTIRNFVRLGLVKQGNDKGALGCVLENEPFVYYNMNEVFLDHTRQYFEYTNDIELMKEIFPVLEGIVEWEEKRLKHGKENLYENVLNTWISDSHWYIEGQCTQASAYILGANNFLADLAVRLGKDPNKYIQKADNIGTEMQEKLWMKRDGSFAEYIETTGKCMLHPEPELPTIYHSAEFGAATEMQIYQMLFWADSNLKTETTYNGGKLYWSSNWFPNKGRSYTHSTYELAFAEELNFALTNYLAGSANAAYELIQASLCGIFSGPTPGGLPCHVDTNGKQRMNDEFADAISMWGRVIVEGLFGIVPKLPDRTIELTPQFPKGWKHASIKSPQFSYEWEHQENRIYINWNAPFEISIKLRIPINAKKIYYVKNNNEEVEYSLKAGIGFSWLNVKIEESNKGSIFIYYKPCVEKIPEIKIVRNTDHISFPINDAELEYMMDPQELLKEITIKDNIVHAIFDTKPGPGIFFVVGGTKECPVWVPWKFQILPVDLDCSLKVWKPLNKTKKCLEDWSLISLNDIFSASSPSEVIQQVIDNAKPPELPSIQISFEYWICHLERFCLKGEFPPSDEAFRRKVRDDGVVWIEDGIPFKSSKYGPNIGVVTRAGAYPEIITIKVNDSGSDLYLLLTGITFPNQSHVTNLSINMFYEDKNIESYELKNPTEIGDCWGTWHGRYHDTAANGFENLGGRFGPSGSIMVDDMTKPVYVDTEAHIIHFIIRKGYILEKIEIEAVANDVIFGIMGATIKK